MPLSYLMRCLWFGFRPRQLRSGGMQGLALVLTPGSRHHRTENQPGRGLVLTIRPRQFRTEGSGRLALVLTAKAGNSRSSRHKGRLLRRSPPCRPRGDWQTTRPLREIDEPRHGMHVQAVQKKHGRLACRVQNATRAGTIHTVGNITLREVSNPEPKIVGCYVCMCIYILRTRGTSAPLLLYYFCHVTFGQAITTSSDTWEWPKSLHKKYSQHSQQTHDL